MTYWIGHLDVLERIAIALERIADTMAPDTEIGPLPGPEKFDALEDIERRRKLT